MNTNNSVDSEKAHALEKHLRHAEMISLSTQRRFSPRRSFLAIRPREEGNQLKSTRKVGMVSVQPNGEKRFILRYRDPVTGRDIRRRLNGILEREALVIAAHVNQESLAGKGYVPGKPIAAPTLKDGIAEAIRHSNSRPYIRKEQTRQAGLFIQWLAEQYPTVRTWSDLKPAMLKGYLIELEDRGLAHDSLRNRLAVVKLAWRHMAENHPDVVRPLPRLKLPPAPRREIECLDPGELVKLLDWLKVNAHDLWPMATLQALAGLRMLEVAALRLRDINFNTGVITITETPQHKPKTCDSYRELPLCAEALNAVQVAIEAQKVIPPGGEIFSNSRGNLWVHGKGLTHRWMKVLKRAALGAECPRLGQVPARKLRAAFATMVSRAGIPDRLLKAYLGHSSGDILGGHYRRIDLAELRSVSDRMNEWRSLFGGLPVWQKCGNSEKCESVSQ